MVKCIIINNNGSFSAFPFHITRLFIINKKKASEELLKLGQMFFISFLKLIFSFWRQSNLRILVIQIL